MTDTTKIKEDEMYQELQNIYLKYNQRKRPLSGQIYETITLIDREVREARKKQPLGTCVDCLSIIIDMSTLDHKSATALTEQKDGE